MYVLYLSNAELNSKEEVLNAYGYYTGKKGQRCGEILPLCFGDKHSNLIKIYNSKKRAENTGEWMLENAAYVVDYRIEGV